MRHQRRTRKLGWKTAHRKSNLRNMVTSLFQHGRIITTVPRAKELRRLADKMITLAKDGSLHAKRQALAVIRNRDVVAKLFTHWKDVMANRNGGYTRLIRLGQRVGDAAPLTIIELVKESYNKKSSEKKVDHKDLYKEKETPSTQEKLEKIEDKLEAETSVASETTEKVTQKSEEITGHSENTTETEKISDDTTAENTTTTEDKVPSQTEKT